MRYIPRLSALALVLIAPAALSAESRPPLAEVEAVTEGLIEIAIAYEIDRVCEPLGGRRIQGVARLLSLNNEARRLGYSGDEIQAFIDDDAEKDRLETVARERLREMGAIDGQAETYCAVGRAEIAKDSGIGSLLDD